MRRTEGGWGQLKGRGDHPGLSAIGTSTTTGPTELRNTERATEPMTAPLSLDPPIEVGGVADGGVDGLLVRCCRFGAR
ncbi:MAG: hypothetical protein ABI658_22045 [Acidimicrobiales bacterium]